VTSCFSDCRKEEIELHSTESEVSYLTVLGNNECVEDKQKHAVRCGFFLCFVAISFIVSVLLTNNTLTLDE